MCVCVCACAAVTLPSATSRPAAHTRRPPNDLIKVALSSAPKTGLFLHFLVVEGQCRLAQFFEGVLIKRQGSGVRETFTVRKQSFGVGVERTFPLHSPKIEKLEVAMIGDVNRAKLYYLRGWVGKKARIRELRHP